MDQEDEIEINEKSEQLASSEHGHHHEHHQQVINRLARIEGHVRAIKRMVEADTPCPDVLTQIAAVRSALNSVGRVILEDHLQSCMVDAVERDDYKRALMDLKNSLDKFI
ncbi:MAG TPA: metal-sensing transcriptional repressor [Anaerolineaceae bacterium]|nr:metal-sensing transcriptional repressor [Anaerolineaceae bacterium]